MNRYCRAFTLIELLVVIAIIAILAAVLFPVFSQAKIAAKKASSLSNIKQNATAIHLYAGDCDDLIPRVYGMLEGMHTTWLGHDVPFDWNPEKDDAYREFARGSWANLILPYQKSLAVLESPGMRDWNVWNEDLSKAAKPLAKVGYSINGLLNTYPLASIASPSQLPLLSQVRGNANHLGYAFSSPVLLCMFNDRPCRYVPTHKGCSAWDQNGEWGNLQWHQDMPSMWAYGRGINIARADTSAKFQTMGMNIRGNTNYRTDFYTDYSNDGVPHSEWMDTEFCHPLLWRPDFDFQDFGTPVEWPY